MAITKSLSDLRKGADITKPELSVQYVVAATFGIVVLIFAWRMAGMIFAKGGEFAQGRIPGVETVDFKAALGIK
jgi:hypothetical protein